MSTIKELEELGAFVPDELVQKTITFKLRDDAEEQSFDVFVRHLSVGTHEEIFRTIDGDMRSTTAKLLAEAIRLGAEGKERMSYHQAFKLHPQIARAMSKAIADVNGILRKN